MRKYALAIMMAGLLAMPIASSAEITWTDIGGDVYLLYFYSANISDFNDDGHGFAGQDDDGDMFRSEIHLNFKADLDDDVSVGVSLEADRDLEGLADNSATNSQDRFGTGDLSVFLEEAYVTIVEPFGYPLSITGGRFFYSLGDDPNADDFNQYWGGAMVIGDGDPLTPMTLAGLGDWETDPFDGVAACFDFDTVTVDAFWLLATDQSSGSDRSHDTEALGLYGSYLGLEDMQIDGYFIWAYSDGNDANFFNVPVDMYTLGARWAGACMDDQIAYKIEGSYEFGDLDNGVSGVTSDGDFDAWAIEAGVNYHPDHDLNPEIGFIYTYQSGDDNSDTDVESWYGIFEDKGYGMIADAFAFTNNHVFHIDASIDLMEDVRLDTDWFYIMLDEDNASIQSLNGDFFSSMNNPGVIAAANDDSLGWEVDAQIDYTYSENVDAFVGAGIFFPGDAVEDALGSDDEAYFIRTGLKVAF